ncbi:hypothetical protein ANN_22850, partial [Periplaneta americana]
MLGEYPKTIRENTGILLEISKGISLKVNTEKTNSSERSVNYGTKMARMLLSPTCEEQRSVVWDKGRSPSEIHRDMCGVYGDDCMDRSNISRLLRWAGHVARMDESRNAYSVLVGRSERKRPLGRPRRRWEDNIKMDLREVGYDDREWINLAQNRDRWWAYV